MADDIIYHLRDEEDGENTLLDRAFDRWEQMEGGSARGPLFQFTMLCNLLQTTTLAPCRGAGAIQCAIALVEGSRG